MRLSFFIFLLSILILDSIFGTPSAKAQFSSFTHDQSPSTWLGFRAGTSIASENFDAPPGGATTGLKFGITGGLDFEHWFGETWGVSAGLLYKQSGVNEQYASSSSARGTAGHDTSGNDNFTLNYLEIPVLLKMAFGFGSVRPFLFAGPSFGFLSSASEATDGNITPVSNLKSDLQNMEISIYFGGGVMGRMDRGPAILFDAGYETGLTKVFKTEPVRQFSSPYNLSSAISNEIIVTIGLLWGL